MISSLSDLAAPLDVAAFRALLRQRSPALFRGAGGDRYASLLDWRGFMDMILTGQYPAKKLRLTQRGAPLPGMLFRSGGTLKPDSVMRLLDTGGSIIAYGIEPYVPAITRLCAAITAQTGEHVMAGAIATTGSGGALDIHYDDSDLLVLQVEGSKRWLIEANPVVDPVAGMPIVAREADAPILIDEVLEPGDLLFLPGGYRHRCETRGARSLHLGFFFYPLTMPRALDLLMRRMMDDTASRKPLRFDDSAWEETEDAMKQELIDRINNLSLSALVAEHCSTDAYPGWKSI